jgi:signal transduction histidine kinase
LFGSANPNSAEQVRSQYAQQIREVARQEERNRLARDLHDSIKQQIFVIQTAAATAQARFDADQAGARLALEQVRGSAREAMTEMQVMLDQLRAVPLENAGLVESLKKQCEALGFRTGAQVEFDLGDLPPTEALPPGAHEAILRAAQEALANVGRHARAGSVLVSLGSGLRQVELRIEDDGAGFDPNQSRRGQGIPNMRARAEEFGGEFELISEPGGGTSVSFSIPYTTPKPARAYLRRAVGWGLVLVTSIFVFAWTKEVGNVIGSAIAAVGVVRYTMAYRRTRIRSGAAR